MMMLAWMRIMLTYGETAFVLNLWVGQASLNNVVPDRTAAHQQRGYHCGSAHGLSEISSHRYPVLIQL